MMPFPTGVWSTTNHMTPEDFDADRPLLENARSGMVIGHKGAVYVWQPIKATDDLDLPGEPLPEGPEEPTTDPIIEEEPE